MMRGLIFILLLVSSISGKKAAAALRPLNLATHYTVLQLTPAASAEQIRQAYLHLIKEYHPDRNPSDYDSAVEASSHLNQSYAFLMDREKRAEYDRELLSKTTDEDIGLSRFTFADALEQTPKYWLFKSELARRVRTSMQISGNGFKSVSSGALRRRLGARSAREFAARLEAIRDRMGFFSNQTDEVRRALVTYDVLEIVALETIELQTPYRHLSQLKWMMSYLPLAREGLLLRVAFSGEALNAQLAPALWFDMRAYPGPWAPVLDNLARVMDKRTFQELMLVLDEQGIFRRQGRLSRAGLRIQLSGRRFCEGLFRN